MFLGIDVGTSGVKAVLIDGNGTVRSQAAAPLSVSRPQPLWAEQDPDDWWAASDAAVLALDPTMRGLVQGIGLSGQMHGATLLGTDDRVLRPAILWNDGRSFAECATLEQIVPDARAITGNIAMPGFTAPKLLWVKAHEPRLFDQVRTVLLPKDYVRLCMTGDKASDLSDSAGTLWLDTGNRSWSDPLLSACGLTRDYMPTLYEGTAVTGRLRPAIAQRWGMAQVEVVAGGGDNVAGAAGVGAVSDGDAFLSLGTSGVIFVTTAQFRPNPASAVHAFCHCLPDLWHQMSVHLSAASCIDWAAKATGVGDPAALFTLAEDFGAANGPELFLPYLSGERTPHNDPHVRGAFLGLDNDSGPAALAAAVLEGVVFAHADGLDALRAAGTRIDALRVIGGGARSRYWGSIFASVFDIPMIYGEGNEVGPALGAARLALIGAGGASLQEACPPTPVTDVVEPNPALAARLAGKCERFKSAYPAIREI